MLDSMKKEKKTHQPKAKCKREHTFTTQPHRPKAQGAIKYHPPKLEGGGGGGAAAQQA